MKFIEKYEHEENELTPLGSKLELVNKKTRSLSNLKIMFDSTTIKFLPTKFNKLTIIINEHSPFLTKFNEECVELGTESFFNERCISLKVNNELKDRLKDSHVKDNIRVVFEFLGIYIINGKKYASFELLDFKKNDTLKNYF